MEQKNTSIFDFHTHSNFSADGMSSIEDYCKRAKALGFSQIGFTEHLDFNPVDLGYREYDYEKNLSEILRIRGMFENDLKILFGAEVTYEKEFEKDIRSYLKNRKFDYLIGSVHLIDSKAISRIDEENYFAGKTEKESYLPYFLELKNAAQSGIFNIIGHFDLIKRYGVTFFGKFNPGKYNSEITEILEPMIKNNIALEINSSGLRQNPKETYPSLKIIKLYKELGGDLITIGSDSHSTEFLGSGIEDSIKVAKDGGFNNIATFENGRIGYIKI